MLKYLQHTIWEMDLKSLPPMKGLWIRFLRISYLTSEGYTKSQIQPGASGLVYYTLLAVVPIIALLIWISRWFQLEKNIESWLIKQFSEQEIIIQKLFEFANNSIKEAKGGLIAGIGIVLFIWAAIKIFFKLRFVLNRIWEVKVKRALSKQFTDYISLFFLAPFVIFAASGLPEILSTILGSITEGNPFLEEVAKLILLLLEIIPYLIICILFTMVYIFIPSTKVHFVPALIAGVLTGIVYEVAQELYVYFQIGVSKYNAIYGTFAAFPLFLIWIHLSWLILLTGSKLCFAIQNVDTKRNRN